MFYVPTISMTLNLFFSIIHVNNIHTRIFVLGADGMPSIENRTANTILASDSCIGFNQNGSLIHLNCLNISREPINSACDSVLTTLHIYGASMIIFANMIYVVPYALVCVLYLLIPDIRRKTYDKVVVSYCITQIVLSIIIITLGRFILCHMQLSKLAYSFFGIALMFMTIISCLWLLVISFDMASNITRISWAPASSAKGREDNHKFLIYLAWVFVGTTVPTALSAILEFSPLAEDSIVKPHFYDLNKLNYRVITHVAIVPLLVAIASSILFTYTTVKMILIKKATNVANENRKKSLKDKYFLYLQLYLLMDAPYISGVLGSIFEDLWILKFVRIMQPIMMLYAVLPRQMVRKVFSCNKKVKNEKEKTKSKADKKPHNPC